MIRIEIDDTAAEDVMDEHTGRASAEADRDDLAKIVAMLEAEVDALRRYIHAKLESELNEICDDAACDALLAMDDDEE